MPRLGLGGGIFGDEAEGAFTSALSIGYRLFDVAPKYGQAEAALGRAIAASNSNIPRSELFLQSKVGNVGKEAALKSFDATLKALRTDYLDLLLMHSAVYQGAAKDPKSPLHAKFRKETWAAMQSLQKAGRVRAVGVCNHSPRQLALLSPPPSVVQLEHHPMLQRNETLSYCRERGIAVQVYGSGGGGWRLWQRHPELDLINKQAIQEAATKHGKSGHQISLRWALEQGLCVIPKAANAEHQKANRQLFDFSLDESEMAAINVLHEGASLYKFRDPDEYL